MNSKRAVISVLVAFSLLAAPRLEAREKPVHFAYGLEWGFTANLYYLYHVNYVAEGTGSRVDARESKVVMRSNGNVTAFAGIGIGRKWEIGALCGYQGIFDNRRVIPLTLRATFFPKGESHMATKYFIEGGIAFASTYDPRPPMLAKLGVGKRIELSPRVKLDFNAALQLCHDRPDAVFDEINHVNVSSGQIRTSDAVYGGINLSLSLNFR